MKSVLCLLLPIVTAMGIFHSALAQNRCANTCPSLGSALRNFIAS
jgi:hypothetical protein